MARIAAPAPPYVGPPKWSGGATNKPIKRVVIHCTAGAEPGVAGAARNTATYSKITTRPSSWHYCRDSREAVQLTYDSVVAFHCGVNKNSIGYELCCSLEDEGRGHWGRDDHQTMLAEAAKDVARLCLAYGVPIRRIKAPGLLAGRKGICGHVDIRTAFPWATSHWDPGPHFVWDQFMAMVKVAAAELTEPPSPVAPLHWPIRAVCGNFDFTNDRADDRADVTLAVDSGAQVVLGNEAKDRDMAALFGDGWTVHQDHGSPAKAGSFVAWRDGIACTDAGLAVGTRARLSDLLPRYITWADLMVDGTTVRFAALHMPPKRHWRPYWNRMARRLERFIDASPYPVVAGGDWNKLLLDSPGNFDRFGGFTGWGIDGFLVPLSLDVNDMQRMRGTRSDHDFVSVDLEPTPTLLQRRKR
jgi:N-acetylmuramoyl-L-alanine amidase